MGSQRFPSSSPCLPVMLQLDSPTMGSLRGLWQPLSEPCLSCDMSLTYRDKQTHKTLARKSQYLCSRHQVSLPPGSSLPRESHSGPSLSALLLSKAGLSASPRPSLGNSSLSAPHGGWRPLLAPQSSAGECLVYMAHDSLSHFLSTSSCSPWNLGDAR